MSFTSMPCFPHEEDEEEEQPKLSSSNSCSRLIPSLIKEACCAHCHVSFCLKSPSSFSSDDEDEETIPDRDLDDKHVIVLEIRSRAMKAKMKPKDYSFADSLHWALSPTSGKLLTAPKEERIDIEQEDDGGGKDDQSEVFCSVRSCFSRCSSEEELDCFSHLRARSVWDEFVHCEGWPFGLCKKAPQVLPPLPSSPSDSWTWRKRNQLGAMVCATTVTSI